MNSNFFKIFAALSSTLLLGWGCSSYRGVLSNPSTQNYGAPTNNNLPGGGTGGSSGGDTTGGNQNPTQPMGACVDPKVHEYCASGGRPPTHYRINNQEYDLEELVWDLAERYPAEFATCDRHNDDFLKIVVSHLRQLDSRWGFNWVRGNVGDSNGDVVGYYYGPGEPKEGSTLTTIVDIVVSCGGATPRPTWDVVPDTQYEKCCNPDTSEKWTVAPLK